MYFQRFHEWSENEYFDQDTRNELKHLSPHEIEDRFYTDLEFGTGGMRGIIGAGTNRINIYVVRRAAQGLAEYILESGEDNAARGVVIAYDSRRLSQTFAIEAALVLANNQIKTFLFRDLRPTPELSFAVRHFKAIAGIVITASHNPKEYNGFKVYWEDGAQVPPQRSDEIYRKIQNHQTVVGIKPMTEQDAKQKGLLIELDQDIDDIYLDRVKRLALNQDLIIRKGHDLNIVFTPLHGTGARLIPKVLNDLGFRSLHLVQEQMQPDPDFSTVTYPNPEIEEAFELALRDARTANAALILASDPDADRLGAMIKDNGKYIKLTGNQLGVLLLNYILRQKIATNTLPENAVIIKTIASTDLADRIARDMGVSVINVLTGFKYIAEKINEIEKHRTGKFIFGFEESNGYLVDDFVRDKDAIIASVLLAEAALYYHTIENKTLIDVLNDIYSQYGYYLEDQHSFTLKGKEGSEKIALIMNYLRLTEFQEIGGIPIATTEDYALGINDLPKSDVLRFVFTEGGFVMARPSGTEPKLKFYFLIKADHEEEAKQKLTTVKQAFITPIREQFGI